MGIFDEGTSVSDLKNQYPFQTSLIYKAAHSDGFKEGWESALEEINKVKLFDGCDWRGNTVYYCGLCGPIRQWDNLGDVPNRCPVCGQKLKEDKHV